MEYVYFTGLSGTRFDSLVLRPLTRASLIVGPKLFSIAQITYRLLQRLVARAVHNKPSIYDVAFSLSDICILVICFGYLLCVHAVRTWMMVSRFDPYDQARYTVLILRTEGMQAFKPVLVSVLKTVDFIILGLFIHTHQTLVRLAQWAGFLVYNALKLQIINAVQNSTFVTQYPTAVKSVRILYNLAANAAWLGGWAKDIAVLLVELGTLLTY